MRRTLPVVCLAAVLTPLAAAAQSASLQDIMDKVAPAPEATIYVAREIITMDPASKRAELAIARAAGAILAHSDHD
jgi:serine protease inhibitor ecotin